MAFSHGVAGQVTWTQLGDLAVRAKAWENRSRKAAVDVTAFNTSGAHDFELGDQEIEGTVTCLVNHDDSPPDHGIAVITLQTKATAPYWTRSGSALLTEMPVSRKLGDTADEIVFAYKGTGSWPAWSRVAS